MTAQTDRHEPLGAYARRIVTHELLEALRYELTADEYAAAASHEPHPYEHYTHEETD